MTAAAPSEIEQKMVTALESAGLFPPGTTARPLRAINGGEVETFVYAGFPGTPTTIWIQRVVDFRAWESASWRAEAVRAAWYTPVNGPVRPAFPVEIGPGLFASAISERVENVADPLLRAVYGVSGHQADLRWLPPLAGHLGSWLRANQEMHQESGSETLPASSPVIAAAADLLAGAPEVIPPMARLARAIHERPRLVRALQDVVRSYQDPAATRLPLHGRFGPAAVLHGSASGASYVTGWIDAARGPGLFDAGYFVGELAECAATARLTGRRELANQLSDAIRAFAAGYAAGKPPGGRRFPTAIADLAGLKVVEHIARYTRHLGDPGAPAVHLLTVAESLVDPRGWLTDLLATEDPPAH